jgi:hypothetical protein
VSQNSGTLCPTTPDNSVKFSEADVKKMVEAAVKEAVGSAISQFAEKTKQDLTPIQNQVNQFMENTKKANIEAFCESRLKQGKISPPELDRPNGKPNLVDLLMTLDGKTPVFKFTENGKEVSLTALDQQMAMIDARQITKLGEKVKNPNDTNKSAEESEEMAQIEKFYEEHQEDMKTLNYTKEEWLKVYKAASPTDRQSFIKQVA